jgi:hypothetical protein
MDQLVITDTDKSPPEEIIVWVLLSTSFMTVAVRAVTKMAYVRKFELDDILILAAIVCMIQKHLLCGF